MMKMMDINNDYDSMELLKQSKDTDGDDDRDDIYDDHYDSSDDCIACGDTYCMICLKLNYVLFKLIKQFHDI